MKLIPLLLLLCCVGCDHNTTEFRPVWLTANKGMAIITVDGEELQFYRARKCDNYLEIIYSSMNGEQIVDSTKNYIPLTDTTWFSLVWLHDSTTGRAFLIRRHPCSN